MPVFVIYLEERLVWMRGEMKLKKPEVKIFFKPSQNRTNLAGRSIHVVLFCRAASGWC